MSSKLKKAIGAVKDQTSISLAKVSTNSSSTNLEVAVLKATSHDDVPVEDKYITEVLEIVSSNKAHAAACARAIGKRISRTRNWVVALKSLMLVLRIFQDGDPYFPREVLHAMKRGAKILNLSGFRDDSNSSPWDFTSFVRTFALYLDERLECFLTGKLLRRYTLKGPAPSFERSKSLSARRPNEPVRDMKPAMLLDKMSYWQRLLDRAIATRPTGMAKTNRLVQISLYAIVQESFDLYKDISDGLAFVLDSFYHLQYQNCVAAFQTCVKATKQFEELTAFYSSCKSMGVGRISEYPSIQVISEELIETLREFLKDQSSFSPSARIANQPMVAPTTPVKVGQNSSLNDNQRVRSSTVEDDRASEVGSARSQSTSLEDLINATETSIAPAISIDLETYTAAQRDDMGASETGSTRSLPVSCSISDLMSLDWGVEEEREEEDKQALSDNHTNTSSALLEPPPLTEHNLPAVGAAANTTSNIWDLSLFESPAANPSATSGWELSLFEAPPAQPPQPIQNPSAAENSSNKGWELALFESAPATAAQPPRQTNTWNLSLFEAPVAQPQNASTAATSTSTDDWELELLEQTPKAEENPSAGTSGWELALLEGPPNVPKSRTQPRSSHYNPFLEDSLELMGRPRDQSPISPLPPPTFSATPTFLARNSLGEQNMVSDDPFANYSDEQRMDPQNLVLQQQLWLQNQSKILAKYSS